MTFVVGVSLVAATPADAVSTWNLRNGDTTPEPSGVNIVTPATFIASDGSQLIADSSPALSSLNQNSNGLGVTTPNGCPTNPQVDTCNSEYIVFELPNGSFDLVSMTLTRLGGGDSWSILGDTDSDPTGAVLLATGVGNTTANPSSGASTNALANDPGLTVSFPGITSFNFIFVQPTAGLQGDLKVAEVVAQVPEPATLLLLGTGLVALVGAARRRR